MDDSIDCLVLAFAPDGSVNDYTAELSQFVWAETGYRISFRYLPIPEGEFDWTGYPVERFHAALNSKSPPDMILDTRFGIFGFRGFADTDVSLLNDVVSLATKFAPEMLEVLEHSGTRSVGRTPAMVPILRTQPYVVWSVKGIDRPLSSIHDMVLLMEELHRNTGSRPKILSQLGPEAFVPLRPSSSIAINNISSRGVFYLRSQQRVTTIRLVSRKLSVFLCHLS